MDWNSIKKSVSDLADKASKKTEELADLAAIKIKIAKKTSDKENEFLKLGKITYAKLTAEDDSHDEELTQGLTKGIEKITLLELEIKKLQLEYDIKKQEAEAQKKAKKVQHSEFGEEEINTVVLDSFFEMEE